MTWLVIRRKSWPLLVHESEVPLYGAAEIVGVFPDEEAVRVHDEFVQFALLAQAPAN